MFPRPSGGCCAELTAVPAHRAQRSGRGLASQGTRTGRGRNSKRRCGWIRITGRLWTIWSAFSRSTIYRQVACVMPDYADARNNLTRALAPHPSEGSPW